MKQLDLQQSEHKKDLARQLRNSIDDLTSYVAIEPTPKDAVDYLWTIEVQKLALNQLEEQSEREALQKQVNALAAEKEKYLVECAAAKIAVAYAKGGKIDFTLNTPNFDAIKRQWMAEGVSLAKNKLVAMGDVSYAPYELDVLADGLLRQPEDKGQ